MPRCASDAPLRAAADSLSGPVPLLPDLRLRRIRVRRERFLPLLLLADESEAMIARYLDRCQLYGLFYQKRQPVSLAAITDESAAFAPGTEGARLAPFLAGKAVCECRNLVTTPVFRGHGFARQLLMRLCGIYDRSHDAMLVGTGDTPAMQHFYRKCGFRPAFVRRGFFRDNYPQPIVEDGCLLEDMLCFCRLIRPQAARS